MNRRDFFKLTMAVGAATLVPAAAPVIPEQPPGFKLGQEMVEAYLAGLQCPFELSVVHTPIMTVDTPEFHYSTDGGVTWELITEDNVNSFSWGEPSQEWTIYDSDPGLHVG